MTHEIAIVAYCSLVFLLGISVPACPTAESQCGDAVNCGHCHSFKCLNVVAAQPKVQEECCCPGEP